MTAGSFCLRLVATAISVALTGGSATSADFYAGKTVNLIVGGSAGGGHDAYGRAVARYMPRHLRGAPTIVVRNMPGAGSASAAGFLFAVAPKDGTTIAALYPGAIMGPLLDDKSKGLFDPTRFIYLGSAENGARICATHQRSTIKSFQDALTKNTILAGSAPGGSVHDYAHMIKKVTGAQFRVVAGYKATVDMTLDMERGEVDGICGWDWSTAKAQKADWIRDKKLNILTQAGLEPDPQLTALGVPRLLDFVKGTDDRKAVEVILSQQVFSRPYAAPPGTPPEIVNLLRAAFDATMRDKDFLVDAEKANLDISPTSGAKLQQLVESIFATDGATIERAKGLTRP